MNQFEDVVRSVKDIGMWAVDRSRQKSCVHATAFCFEHCFNAKLEVAFPTITPKDVRNDAAWESLNGASFKAWADRRRKPVERFRFMTRGEAFACLSDVDKVADVVASNPSTLFWIPTRAWRNREYREAIELKVMILENARVLASIDPTNDFAEVAEVMEHGWSTMFFGDDSATDGRVLCEKTHSHTKGACATCSNGCFQAKFGEAPVHVHLKQH